MTKTKLVTADDMSIMCFGKHNGQRLGDIPDSYIKWLWENTDIDTKVNDNTEQGSIARYFKLAYKDKKKY